MFLLGLTLAVLVYLSGVFVSFRLIIGVLDNVHGSWFAELARWLAVSVLFVYGMFIVAFMAVVSIFSIKMGVVLLAAHLIAWLVSRKVTPL